MEELIVNKNRRGEVLGIPTPNEGHFMGKRVQSAKELILCAPTKGGSIEITLTYPHTASYLRMNSERQKKLLTCIFRDTCCAIPNTHHVESKCYFEYDSHAQIHLHGYLILSNDLKVYPLGVLSDMVKACLSEYPKKYNKFVETNMYGQYTAYKSPQCKLQYRYVDSEEDSERFASWLKYCVKLQ